MISMFRRKAAPSLSPQTFNERVAAFWHWFEAFTRQFSATKKPLANKALMEEVGRQMNLLLPGFGWVFGPGENNQGHSFTLSGEGVLPLQLLAREWLARAPRLRGWTFYAARQPGQIQHQAMRIDQLQLETREIWVTPHVDAENERIDLTVWHPAWSHVEEQRKYSATFLFLDEALGEYATGARVGKLNFTPDRLADAFPLAELAEFVGATAKKLGWKATTPGETWSLIDGEAKVGAFPRSDTVTQITAVTPVIIEFMNSQGELQDPIAGTGADFVYVSIATDFFPDGREVDGRAAVEDAVEAELQKIAGGRCVGGAFGVERCYSDFLIFDGARSLAAIAKALKARNVPAGTMIEFFAREKRAQRLAV